MASLCLNVGYLFLVGSSVFLSIATAGFNFGALTGDERISFYSAILNWKMTAFLGNKSSHDWDFPGGPVCASNAGGTGSIPGQETKTPTYGTTKKKKKT